MQKHSEWLRFAQDDLKTAIIVVKSEDIVVGSVLYHCQQAFEKILKAYLAYNKEEIRKTHDLVELVHLCAELDQEFLQLLSDATELNPYATKSRYPDAHFTMPYVPFAEWAVTQTKLVFIFVENKMEYDVDDN